MRRPRAGARTVATAAAVNAANSLPLFLTGALAVQMRQELGFGRVALGVAVATMLAGAAGSAVVLGRLVQRIGPAAGMRIGAGLTTLVCVGIATTAGSHAQLLAWLLVGGLALAVGESSSNLWLGQRVRTARLGAAFGFKQGALPGASLVAGLSVPALALTVGWRWAWLAAGAAAALAGMTVRSGRRHVADARSQGPHGGGTAQTRALVMLSVASGCGFAAAMALGAFLVDYAVTIGVREGIAGILLATGGLCAIGVRVGLGQLADLRAERSLPVVALLLLSGGFGHLLLAAGVPALVPLGAVLGYGLGYGWAGLLFFSITRLNPTAAGASSGVVLTGGFTGSLSGPLLFGALADGFSYTVAWLVTALLSGIAAAAMLFGNRLLRQGALDQGTLDK